MCFYFVETYIKVVSLISTNLQSGKMNKDLLSCRDYLDHLWLINGNKLYG